jgi:NAD(P)-dependent dehydrogenase (short-subunit alcohol dehydrogenase family)
MDQPSHDDRRDTSGDTSGDTSDSMRGRVCLVTGATSGIGQVTAGALVRRGATVLFVARERDRAEQTLAAIKQQTPGADVDYLLADLTSQAQVRRLADEVRARHDQLHVLVNNAGAVFTQRFVTVDGIEKTFALNHLAPFLLTNLLLDTLQASAPARVVTVSSMAHRGVSIPFDDLNQTHAYRAWTVYGQSKLANILFTYELARRLEGTGVTANTLHPGFVASGFNKNNGPVMAFAMTLARPFAISIERGAQTSIYLATSPEVVDISGRYFVNSKPATSSPQSNDEAAQHRLWEVSERLTRLSVEQAAS